MLCAQNAAPRQQWTPPMTITPQVAPMANQAFETSQFIFFLKHPNSPGLGKGETQHMPHYKGRANIQIVRYLYKYFELISVFRTSNVGIRHSSEFRIPNSCSFVRKYMADRACSQIKSLYFCKRNFSDILQYCFFIISSQVFMIISLSYFYNCTKNSKSVSCLDFFYQEAKR